MSKTYLVTVNGVDYEVTVAEGSAQQSAAPRAAAPAAAPQAKPAATGAAGGVKVNSPLPGTLLKIEVSQGQSVKKGDLLCIIEAMKMENEILAPQDGTVASINASKGSSLNPGDLIMTLA